MFLMIILLTFSIVLLILLVPTKLEILIGNGKFEVFIYFFFMKFNIFDSNRKRISKKINVYTKLDNFSPRFKFLGSKLGIVSSFFRFVIKKIKFKKIHLIIRVCADDSKECAVNYSYICSSLELLVQIFDLNKKTEDLKIRVLPDFLSFKTTCFGKIILSITLLEIIYLLFYYLIVSCSELKTRE